jgi:hypothetical protein
MRQNRRITSLILILCLLAGGLLAHAEPPLPEEPPEESPDLAPVEVPEDELDPPADDSWQEPAEQPWQAPPMDEPLAEPAEDPFAVPAAEPEEPAMAPEEPAAAPAEVPVKAPKPPRKSGTAAPAGKTGGATFRVRLAEAGKGFRAGVAGQLRVTSSGLAFTREGGARADWSISWKDLMAAQKESGLWDAPFVLGLVERDGRRRYIARLDKSGRYLDAAPILAAIARTGGAKFK